MSWHVQGKFSEVDRMMEEALSQNPECKDQVLAAIDAAAAIRDSGCCGSSCDFHITLSGHSNPNHEKREGWANDVVTVAVAQV